MRDGVAGVGVVGCGAISKTYFNNIREIDNLRVIGCADIDEERAKAKGEEYEITAAPLDDLFSHPDIDVILNLTIPAVHAEITLRALENGKHAYSEKPLGITRNEGRAVLQSATRKGLRVGCAPDTFLGAGYQTCRALLEDGTLGQPFAASACIMGGGMENWHPNPTSFFQPGAGPMFDMGVYYLTGLVHLFGPIRRIVGSTTKGFATREITTGPKQGTQIPVNIDTTVMGVAEFVSGPIASVITSFDVKGGHRMPSMEIHGSAGSISCGDPNVFDAPVSFIRAGESETWENVDLLDGYSINNRGAGLSDMVTAIQEKRPHRASGEMAYHVLDAMEAFYDASAAKGIVLESQCDQPAAAVANTM